MSKCRPEGLLWGGVLELSELLFQQDNDRYLPSAAAEPRATKQQSAGF
jgi:hypothetical protein